MSKIVVIVNMQASQAARLERSLESYFAETGIAVERIFYADDKESIERCFDQALALKPEVIVLGGGDGTLNSGMKWFGEHGYTGRFGVLPLGTSNYLARNLNIPLGLSEAIKHLRVGQPLTLRFGVANDVEFSLLITVGYTTRVSARVDTEQKKALGQGAYVAEGVRQLAKAKAFDYVISLDGGRQLRGQAAQISVYRADINQQVLLTPTSTLRAETLKLVIHRAEAGFWAVIASVALYALSFGRVRRNMTVANFTRAEIKTAVQKDVAVDGEVATATPLSVRLADHTYDVIA